MQVSAVFSLALLFPNPWLTLIMIVLSSVHHLHLVSSRFLFFLTCFGDTAYHDFLLVFSYTHDHPSIFVSIYPIPLHQFAFIHRTIKLCNIFPTSAVINAWNLCFLKVDKRTEPYLHALHDHLFYSVLWLRDVTKNHRRSTKPIVLDLQASMVGVYRAPEMPSFIRRTYELRHQ